VILPIAVQSDVLDAAQSYRDVLAAREAELTSEQS
jgi:hypothetical protein